VSAFGKKPICFLIWSKSVTDSTTEIKYYVYETPDSKFTAYIIKSTLATASTPSKVIYKNSYDVNTLEQAIATLGHNVIYKPRVDPVWTLQSTSLETSSDLKTKMSQSIPITRPRGVLVYFSTLTQEEGDRESVVVFKYNNLYNVYKLSDKSDGKYKQTTYLTGFSTLAAAVVKVGLVYDPAYREPT